MSIEIAAIKLGASNEHALELEKACLRFGITTPLEKAHFFANMLIESARFTRTRENLNYSVTGLLSTFGRHRISVDDANRYGRAHGRKANQEAIANRVYGGAWGRKNLGNTQPGDGWRFIGRGDKQLTGRGNATAYSRAIYGDDRIVDNPELLERLPDCALSAAWFWNAAQCDPLAEIDNAAEVRRRINGGSNGLQEVLAALPKCKALFGA